MRFLRYCTTSWSSSASLMLGETPPALRPPLAPPPLCGCCRRRAQKRCKAAARGAARRSAPSVAPPLLSSEWGHNHCLHFNDTLLIPRMFDFFRSTGSDGDVCEAQVEWAMLNTLGDLRCCFPLFSCDQRLVHTMALLYICSTNVLAHCCWPQVNVPASTAATLRVTPHPLRRRPRRHNALLLRSRQAAAPARVLLAHRAPIPSARRKALHAGRCRV